jgi:hypothetical protein
MQLHSQDRIHGEAVRGLFKVNRSTGIGEKIRTWNTRGKSLSLSRFLSKWEEPAQHTEHLRKTHLLLPGGGEKETFLTQKEWVGKPAYLFFFSQISYIPRKVTNKIREHFELNENENTTYLYCCLWNEAK